MMKRLSHKISVLGADARVLAMATHPLDYRVKQMLSNSTLTLDCAAELQGKIESGTADLILNDPNRPRHD